MAPSGTLVFAAGRSGDFDIFTFDFGSKEVLQLTGGPFCNDQPRWSPDGSQVVYTSNRAGGVFQLWAMNAKGGNRRQLTFANVHHTNPAWSPTGEHILCCANYREKDEIDLWLVPVEGRGEPRLLVHSPGIESDPTFSPDGRRVVFSSARSGNVELWEYDIAKNSFTQRSFHQAKDFGPSYSPDGTMLAFVSTRSIVDDPERPPKDADIYVMVSDGSREPLRVTRNKGADLYVGWSPDGDYLVYCASSGFPGTGRIQLIDVRTSNIHRLKYDRSEIEQELGAEISDFGLFSMLTPDVIQRASVTLSQPDYWGHERYPHWKRS